MGSIPSLNECKPGWEATEYNVLVAAEEVETVTKGGIIIIDQSKEKQDAASSTGLLVSASPLAFSYERTWPEGSRKPEPGDVVMFKRYAGIMFDGDDGRKYRVIKDQEISAIKSQA